MAGLPVSEDERQYSYRAASDETAKLSIGTSDAIYKDKTGIYDLLVDCSGSEILPSADDEGFNAAREPVMRAVVRDKGQASLKYVTYTYSDTVLWNAILPLLSDQAADGTPRKAPSSIWSTAIGTYTYICDICWDLCSYATGSAYAATRRGQDSAGGYIRLPTGDNAGRGSSAADSDDEDDGEIAEGATENTRTGRAIQILKILDHRRDHIEKHLAHTVAEAGTPTLSKDDMRHMGLSAWSWVDVEFVRGLHRLRKREPVFTGTLGIGLEVEKGWFRKAIGLVGL
ncbi:hypothetical protein NCC49_006229 [Naganishia albida]|nr:hypothetical protein NCC49_006229 [Naganishia albida]